MIAGLTKNGCFYKKCYLKYVWLVWKAILGIAYENGSEK